MKLMATGQRFLRAGITALAMVGLIALTRPHQPSLVQPPPGPGTNNTGNRAVLAPETPQRPTNLPQWFGSRFALRSDGELATGNWELSWKLAAGTGSLHNDSAIHPQDSRRPSAREVVVVCGQQNCPVLTGEACEQLSKLVPA